MAKRNTPSERDRPPGSQPTQGNDEKDRRIREEAQKESGSESTLEPEDEQFIDSIDDGGKK